jgi:hypothetical protein
LTRFENTVFPWFELPRFVDENAGNGGYFKDYAFWRVSVGVTFGFPR